MFSGIIAALGRITIISPRHDGAATLRLRIDAHPLGLDDVGLGAVSYTHLDVYKRQGQ